MRLLLSLLLLLVLALPSGADRRGILLSKKVQAAGGGGGGYAFVFSASKGGNTETATSDAVDTTGATLIVVATSHFSPTPTLSDSKGNTWTALTTYGPGSYEVKMYYCVSPTVGSGHTFTLAGANTYPTFTVLGFSGGSLSSPFDQQNGATGSSFDTVQPGSITPTQDNELVVTALSGALSGTPASIDSGFSTPVQIANGSGAIFNAIAYKIQTTAAAVNPTWSVSATASTGAAAIASFK
jgi:hypothetical protein